MSRFKLIILFILRKTDFFIRLQDRNTFFRIIFKKVNYKC